MKFYTDSLNKTAMSSRMQTIIISLHKLYSSFYIILFSFQPGLCVVGYVLESRSMCENVYVDVRMCGQLPVENRNVSQLP